MRCTDVLDPFEVEDGWFEIILPSLQLVPTDAIPPEQRTAAETILKRLHLGHDERVLRQRRAGMRLYEAGKLTLDGLAEVDPLLARAIDRQGGGNAAART